MNTGRCSRQDLDLPDVLLRDDVERRLVAGLLRSLQRPDAVVERVVVGPMFVAVTASGSTGLASLLGARARGAESKLADSLVGRSAAEAAAQLTGDSRFSVSVGLAALNAANAPTAHPIAPADAPAETLIAKLGRGKTVGLVGEFPFAESLREQVGDLKLFELRDVPGAVAREHWDAVLAEVDVLAVTGTALLTRKLGYFLAQAARAVAVVLGPSTPLSPSLFDCGADYLCGSLVTDPDQVIAGVTDGLPFHAMRRQGGIRLVQLSRPPD
ncbi:MAG: DUF364 domain-containing protein [Candidatus Krumholzibacteria bacterium]|nr:DUF364 domain-containing protein [Candidatus Krumholzibacteria bacterium]